MIQGLLFIFFEPAIDDVVNREVAFSSMEELREAVDKTKHGGSAADCNPHWIPFKEYSKNYKGPVPQLNTIVSGKPIVHWQYFTLHVAVFQNTCRTHTNNNLSCE